jgi:hypothetical protein
MTERKKDIETGKLARETETFKIKGNLRQVQKRDRQKDKQKYRQRERKT